MSADERTTMIMSLLLVDMAAGSTH